MKRDLTIKQVQDLLVSVYKRFRRGEISETTANKEAYILNSILKTIELTDLEGRLARVESILTDNN